jgi:hypothetical protein
VAGAVGVPVLGVVSDGQTSVRRAVAEALPGVPHQLCRFHFLREAAHPVFEADRHAKVALKAEVRGVRPIERSLEGREDPRPEVARGYCAAVRSAVTDDGRPPLAASGLKLKARLQAVADSLDRGRKRGRVAAARAAAPADRPRPGAHRRPLAGHRAGLRLGAPGGAHPGRRGGEAAAVVRRRFDGLVGAMARHRAGAGVWQGRSTTSSRSRAATGRGCSTATPSRTCRAPTTASSSCSARSATTSARDGRRAASPAAVLRGEVRLIAATATRLRPPSARDLGRVSRDRWRDLRERLDRRRHARTLRSRFRRDPGAYLAALEQQACQPALPT